MTHEARLRTNIQDARVEPNETYSTVQIILSKMPHEEQDSLGGLIRERWNTFHANHCNYLKVQLLQTSS